MRPFNHEVEQPAQSVDLGALFMSPDRVDELVRWDTIVVADVVAGTMTQDARLESAVAFFRTILASVCLMESALVLGFKTLREAMSHSAEVFGCAVPHIGFDPLEVLTGGGSSTKAAPADPDAQLMPLEKLRDVVTSVLASTDHPSLLEQARRSRREPELKDLVARLIRFLKRTDVYFSKRIDVLADKYVKGGLTVSQVASVLGIDEADALFLLDEKKVGRSATALTSEGRAEKLARIASERAARAGKPRADDRRAVASAISSARLEGVDVRGCQTNR